jgi:hypothetical protein
MRKRLAIASGVLLAVSIIGLIGWQFLGAFVFDKYAAYGEVPIPGTRTLHLPQGDVEVSFHTEIAGSMEGGGLPIPQGLEVSFTPPSGVAAPKFIQDVGETTADNQDVRVAVGVVHIPTAGDYTITANGRASAYLSPRLSFGHGSSYGYLDWLFLILGGVGLLGLLASPLVGKRGRPIVRPKPTKTPLRRLEDIASLHKSGALTDEEYEAEKRRILDQL